MDHALVQGGLMQDERRKFPRCSVVLWVNFRWLDYSGEAMTADLSMNGCRITAAYFRGLVRGSFVILSLEIPGEATPILVNPAKIQWVSHDRFGVEFLSSRDGDQRRLDTFLKQLEAGQSKLETS